MARPDRGLSVSHRIGRRGIYHLKPVSSVWLQAIAAGFSFRAAGLVELHGYCSRAFAVASWASGAGIQRDDHASRDVCIRGLWLCGWFLCSSADTGDLVCISPANRAAGATAGAIAMVLSHIVAWIR